MDQFALAHNFPFHTMGVDKPRTTGGQTAYKLFSMAIGARIEPCYPHAANHTSVQNSEIVKETKVQKHIRV
jgi:hypothetical protein